MLLDRALLARIRDAAVEQIGARIGAAASAASERGLMHFPFFSQAIAQLPMAIGCKLRSAIYSQVFGPVGKRTVIQQGVVFDGTESRIGDDVWISYGCYIECADIGDHALIGPHARLLAAGSYHRHERTDVPIKLQGNQPRKQLKIGEGAWIGCNAIVMADVGDHAIVGAGAVVTKSVAPYSIVVGNPARLVRMRNQARSA